MTIIRTTADYERAFAAGFRPRYIRDIEGFSAACINDNELTDLIDDNGAITTDDITAREWDMTVDEQVESIRDAIESCMDDFNAGREAD